MLKDRLLFFSVFFFLVACNTIPPSPSMSLVDTPIVSPTSTPTDVPSVTPDILPTAMITTSTTSKNEFLRTQYYLSAILNYNFHTLAVQEQITYTNKTDTALAELVLAVEPVRWPGAFTLTTLNWEDGTPITAYHWDVQHLILSLSNPLASGDVLKFSLAYTLNIPVIPIDAERPVPFGYSDRQVNLVDWYVYVLPYQHGWLANTAGFFGEHQVSEMADFKVDLQLETPPPGLVLAASASAQTTDNHYHYEMKAARSFAISASTQYEILMDTLTLENGRMVTVTHYGSPFVAAMAPQVLSDTMRSVQIYSELFAPYPHDSLSVVQADFLDGMEYDGLFFLSNGFYNTYNGRPDDYLTAIAVHETAHQWWYALVGNDQALEPWLDEALSTYSEVLYYERVYPASLDSWWMRRVDFYNPTGLIDLPVYQYFGFISYRDAVYLRGALFLRDLRDRVGDKVFFAFLKDYANQGAQKIVTSDDFFTILGRHTNADISALIMEYFGP